jgi:hypothetical protein
MTIRIPDERHERLRQLAKHRGISVNKLVEEFATIGLAQFDAELRFRSLGASISPKRSLGILDRLDTAFGPRK